MSKLLALTPFHIYPPTFGGAERCWNLLSRLGPIDIIALNWEGHNAKAQLGDVNYQLIAADAKAVERAIKLRKSGVKTFDPMPSLTANDLTTVRQAIDNSDPDLVILEHPWLIDLIGDRPFIYDAHNCETVNTGQQHGRNSYDYELVKDLEKRAAQNAEHITYCNINDINQMSAMFNINTPTTLIPNGINLPEQTATGESRNLIFIGSAYQPNVNAAQRLANLAPALPDYTIQIIGACGHYINAPFPNVQIIGQVNEQTMHNLFINAHAFINLVTEGSGTHLKLARALAYGLPVITTPEGARGYTNVTITGLNNVITTITNLNWEEHHNERLQEADTLNWDTLAERYRATIRRYL